MPLTVDAGFRSFLSTLTPTGAESASAIGHRASIKTCLESNFGTLEAYFRTGSFGNGTSISGYSDVDYLAALPSWEIPYRSDSLLSKVRVALDSRFPVSQVHVRTPAVVVPFGSVMDETTEIVPARYEYTNTRGYRVFGIAAGNGNWMKTSPDAHNAYVRQQDQRLDNRVKPLVRFLKAWKYYKNAEIASFYLEMRAARFCEAERVIEYPIDLTSMFRLLLDCGLAQLQDPMGVSGYIPPCTPGRVDDALSKVRTALTHATNAVSAANRGAVAEAYRQWNIVFGHRFPDYG